MREIVIQLARFMVQLTILGEDSSRKGGKSSGPVRPDIATGSAALAWFHFPLHPAPPAAFIPVMSAPVKAETPVMEKIVSLCKRRGFIYQSSEIYGGINGFWDYGPLGTELKRNLRDAWWRTMTREREDVVGLDATIIMHPAIWKASGHVDTFADPMVDCLVTNKRLRADQIEPQHGVVYKFSGASGAEGTASTVAFSALAPAGKPRESALKTAKAFYTARGVKDPEPLGGETGEKVENSTAFNPENGAELTEPRMFNLMLKTHAIFAQYKNVVDSSRVKVPFGICQIGKAFRNEINPRNFTFRSREFEQMELEFFIKPDEAIEIISGKVAAWSESADLSVPLPDWGWEMWHRYWVAQRTAFYESIGLGKVIHYYWQTKEELAHYARACVDILCEFPFGTEELEGVAARGDFDLSQHQKHCGKPLEFFDEELKTAAAALSDEAKEVLIQRRLTAEQAKEKGALTEAEVRAWFERLFKGFYLPHVIEPSAGLDRMALAVIAKAFEQYEKEDGKGKSETITVLRLHPTIAPIKVGVFPLLKNKPELVAKARSVFQQLKGKLNTFYDESGAIGRRYARQDEIGTPFCVTIDFETLGEQGPELADTVTVRERDGGAQHRVKISELNSWLLARC
jgi:glycyl-tRNA synthetase